MNILNVVVKEKVNANTYDVQLEDGKKLRIVIPLKYLMNYINVPIGSTVAILEDSKNPGSWKFATKADFIKYGPPK